MKIFVTCLAVVAMLCVGTARVEATSGVDVEWSAGPGVGVFGVDANWDGLHAPNDVRRGSISSAGVLPLTVNVNAPAEALELFINSDPIVSIGVTTLNINDTSLTIGENSFGASMFIRAAPSTAVVNIDGPDGLLSIVGVGASGAGQIHSESASEWNLTGGAVLSASTFRRNTGDLAVNISDNSLMDVSMLRLFGSESTLDLNGPDARLIVDFVELDFGTVAAHLALLEGWVLGGLTDDNTIGVAGGRIRGYAADGVTLVGAIITPLDGVDLLNGVVITAVPEPTSLVLMGLGLLGTVCVRRRRS